MHNDKVLNDNPNETEINKFNRRNKDTCPRPIKSLVYQANVNCDIARYKQKCYLSWCETTFKDCFGNHKTSFNHIKDEVIRNYQNNFGKLKSATKHEKLYGKYVILKIQIVNAGFYV